MSILSEFFLGQWMEKNNWGRVIHVWLQLEFRLEKILHYLVDRHPSNSYVQPMYFGHRNVLLQSEVPYIFKYCSQLLVIDSMYLCLTLAIRTCHHCIGSMIFLFIYFVWLWVYSVACCRNHILSSVYSLYFWHECWLLA